MYALRFWFQSARNSILFVWLSACKRLIGVAAFLGIMLFASAAIPAQASVFNPQGEILEITCIRNTGYGENTYPPGFSLVATRGADGLVVIDPTSITGLQILPEDCSDQVVFTFNDTGQIASLDLELVSLQLVGSIQTFDVRLNSWEGTVNEPANNELAQEPR